jgi:Kdo2-lipid IVA lauroyltransferase/acyltransferase
MSDVRRLAWQIKNRLRRSADHFIVGPLLVGLMKTLRRGDLDRGIDRMGRLLRRLGPLLPEHRIGRQNLAAAFPEKSPAQIEEVLLGVWENLGQFGAEFANLDRLWDYDPSGRRLGRIEASQADADRFTRLSQSGKPVLVFAAHLGNWELAPLGATAHGLKVAVLYRAPSVSRVATAVRGLRAEQLGLLIPTGPYAPFKAAGELESGTSVGMLVDQHSIRGAAVEFFGRRCMANTMIARLARQLECPIHGTRTIRLPGHRFRIELTEAITPPRAADGRIDVPGTMQLITAMVEGWVREYPKQWLWLHRRWR